MRRPLTIDRALTDTRLLGAALGNPDSWRTWMVILRAAYVPRLQAHLASAQRAEKKAAWVKDYEAVVPRVDALAEELKAVYCEFVPKLIDILTRARELNEVVRHVRSAKSYPEAGEPDDGRHLYEVELVARGYTGLGQGGLSLDRDLLLPNFADPSKKAWPPHEVPLAVQVAQSVLTLVQHLPQPGSSAEYELRRRHQREQADRLKAHYERQEKERRERAEHEARARAVR